MKFIGIRMVSVDPNHAFPSQNLLQLGLRLGYLSVVSTVFCVRSVCCVAGKENKNSSIIIPFHLITVNNCFRLLHGLIYIAIYSLFIAKFTPKLASECSFILLKIGHLTRDFVLCLASDRIVLDLTPQLSIEWLLMRLTGVSMVSKDPDHAFPCQNLLELGIRLGYWTVASKVPCPTI